MGGRYPEGMGSFQKPQMKVLGGLPPEGDFTPVDPIDAGVPTWRRPTGHDGGPWYESQLHQSEGNILREIQRINHAGLALLKVCKGEGHSSSVPATPATSTPSPSTSSEPSSGSHRAKNLVENHFHLLTISEQHQRRSRTSGLGNPPSFPPSPYGQPVRNSPFSPLRVFLRIQD